AQMDRAFENLTEEEIEKYNIIKVTSSKNPIQRQVTPEEIDEFNTLVKKFNSKPEKERIIRVKDKNPIEYTYSLMTSEQKKENEEFPNFVRITTLPIPYNASQDLKTYINERKKATDFIEKHKIDYPLGYLELSESKQKEFMNLYKAMSLAFNNLPESEKQTALKILPPPPSAEMYK